MGELTELLEIALHDPDEKKREAAGTLVVQTLAESGQFETLCEMTGDEGLTESTKWAAVAEALKGFASQGRYDVFAIIAETEIIPGHIREAARKRIEPVGMARVEIENEQGHYDCLTLMSGDARLPPNVRELAGVKAVEGYVAQQRCGCLVEIAENEKLPQKVREIARNNIEPTGLFAAQMLFAFGYYDQLVEVSMDEKMPQKVRETAGSMAIEGYIKTCLYSKVPKMVRNARLLQSVREEAGFRAIEEYSLEVDSLVSLAKGRKVPNKIREAAGLEAVKTCAIAGFPQVLEHMIKSRSVLRTVRQAAAANLGIAQENLSWKNLARGRDESTGLIAFSANRACREEGRETAGLKAIELIAAEGLYGRLERMILWNDKLPLAVREAAGKKAVGMCVAKISGGYSDWETVLRSLAFNEKLPESVREAVKIQMEAQGIKVGVSGISPGCSILSEGTVKPPKNGECEKELGKADRGKAPVS